MTGGNDLAVRAVSAHNAPSLTPVPTSRRKLPELLEAIAELIRRYVILPSPEAAVVLALYVAHTFAFQGAHSTPYLLVVSPEKRSGKSRLLEVLALLCARAWMVASASEAALYRKIGQDQPTLLFDEIDATFGVASERTEPIRAVLNAGNRRGASVPRCVGTKMDEVRDFDVFCPKVLAGIDVGAKIPETVRDRSLEIRMVRRTGGEKVERFRYRRLVNEVAALASELEQWADGAIAVLLEVEPQLPEALDDRKAEATEPLFAIADMAGGDWPTKSRSAVLALAQSRDEGADALGTLLLAKLRDVFGDRPAITTAEICETVNADDDLPFGAFGGGTGLDARLLSKLLRPYSIRPTSVRVGDRTPKGYRRDAFEDAWERYVPRPESPQQGKQPQQGQNVADANPHENHDVADVADVALVPDTPGVVADDSVCEATEAEQAEAERLIETYGGDAA